MDEHIAESANLLLERPRLRRTAQLRARNAQDVTGRLYQ